MHKGKISRQLKNFTIYKDLYGKPLKRDWAARLVFLIQILLIFGGRWIRYFSDIRLKILRLPNFNMPFQLVLTKFFKSKLFSRLPKADHMITVMQRAYSITVLYTVLLNSISTFKICCDSICWYTLMKAVLNVNRTSKVNAHVPSRSFLSANYISSLCAVLLVISVLIFLYHANLGCRVGLVWLPVVCEKGILSWQWL